MTLHIIATEPLEALTGLKVLWDIPEEKNGFTPGESVVRAKSVIPNFTYDEKGMGTLKPVWLKWELVIFFQQAKNQVTPLLEKNPL